MSTTKKCPECEYEMPMAMKECPRCGMVMPVPGFFEYYGSRAWHSKSKPGSLFPTFDFSAPMPMKQFWISMILIFVTYGGIFVTLLTLMPELLGVDLSDFVWDIFHGYGWRNIMGIIPLIIFVSFIIGLLLKPIELQIRRLKDIQKSGWFVVLSFIPILNIWPIILYFTKGSEDMKPQWNQKDWREFVSLSLIWILCYIVFPLIIINASSYL